MADDVFEARDLREDAWTSEEAQEVFDVLSVLETAESPENLCALLMKHQVSLFSRIADQVLDFLIDEEEDSSNPQLQWLMRMRDFLGRASIVGVQREFDETGLFLYDALRTEQQFQSILSDWIEIASPREQRCFLEQHLEIVQQHSLRRLQNVIHAETGAKDKDEEAIAILNHRRSILNEILQRGSSFTAVREAYVNRVNGFALDIPPWLEDIEARIEGLAEQPNQHDIHIAIEPEAIARARQDTDVAPETLATLQYDLGTTLRTTLSDQPLPGPILEEANVLQLAAQQTFTLVRYPLQHAQVQFELGHCYLERLEGDRSENIERALLHLEQALQVFNKIEFPLLWADLQVALGQAFYERIAHEKSENLERALNHQLAALEIYQRESYPIEWGEIQSYLGRTYQERMAGEKGENVERALNCQLGALEVIQREMFPEEWANIQFRLSQLYMDRVAGDRRENLREAEKHCKETFQVYTRETFPYDWAMSHLWLAAFYSDFGSALDVKKDYGTLALEHCREAEQVFTLETAPQMWALVQQGVIEASLSKSDAVSMPTIEYVIARGEEALKHLPRTIYPSEWTAIQVDLAQALHLKAVYAERMTDRAELMEQALAHVESALQVYGPADAPANWVKAQRIQAQIYMERINGQQSENLARAKYCCEQVLRVLTPEHSAPEWAEVQTLLGTVLLAGQDKQKETIEQAIACFKRSLERCDPLTTPFTWAKNHRQLCAAYVERIEGDRQHNIEIAIKHGEAVLGTFTREDDTVMWAETQFYLGIAYARRAAGERRVNVERAILCFEYAAEILTAERAPLLNATIQANLGSIYFERFEGKPGESVIHAEKELRDAHNSFGGNSRESALAQMRMAMIYQNQIQSPGDENARQAEALYREVLAYYLNNNDSLNAAYVYLLLGGYYQTLLLSKDVEAYRQQALSCYYAALQTFTRQNTPYQWAIVQFALGMIMGITPGDRPRYPQPYEHAPASQQEQAVGFLKQVMTILTPEAFPYNYHTILNIWLHIEWDRGNWREVVRLAQAIYKQEETLLRISTGIAGLDTVLASTHKISPAERGAFAILLGNYQRRNTSGHDWSQNLIRQLMLPQAPPEDIERAALLLERGRAVALARALADYLAAPERIQNAERRTRYEEAHRQLLQSRKKLDQTASLNVVETISMQNREIFLESTAACELAQRAFEEIVAEIRQAQDPADFYTITIDHTTLQQAASQGGPGHTLVYLVALEKIGGFAIAIQASLKPGDASLRFASCMLPGLTSEVIQELVKGGAEHHLSSCREKLAPLLLRPLLRWLQKQLKPSSLTLIPCGHLVGLPLASLLIDGDNTLGDLIPTSVAPSALSLVHVQPSDNTREGVYTFGNPRSDLVFAEGEARALYHIAHQLGITSESPKVQKGATSKALLETLKHAQVVDLACHGQVTIDDYLQSSLSLADKHLTLGTILNWQRDMQGLRLLILSACESAAADLQGAVDEVRSINTAMLQADARAVLAPLWKVKDVPTLLLITRFAAEWFPHMESEPPAAALGRAQSWLRRVTNRQLQFWEANAFVSGISEEERSARKITRSYHPDMLDPGQLVRSQAQKGDPDERPFANPIHWAGFQVVGW